MKKLLIVLMLFVLCACCFTACQGDGEGTPDEPAAVPELPALSTPAGLTVLSGGSRAFWQAVTNANGYVLKVEDTEIEVSGTYTDDIAKHTKYAGIYRVSVKARGDKVDFADSPYTSEYELFVPTGNDELRVSGNTVWGYGTALATDERTSSELVLFATAGTTLAACNAIGADAFMAENVTRVYVSLPIASVGTKAFFNCKLLQSVQLPSTLTTVSEFAFFGADKLAEIRFESALPPTLGANALPKNEGMKIVVPKDSVESYKNAWTDFADVIFAAE